MVNEFSDGALKCDTNNKQFRVSRQEHKYIIQKKHMHLYIEYTHKDVEIKG